MQLYIPKITRNSSTCRVYFVLSLCIKQSTSRLSSKFLYNAVRQYAALHHFKSTAYNWLLSCLSEGFTLICIYTYIYINIILVNDSDLFKFLLIYSLFLSYFAELKFPVKCTDDSWAVGSEVIVAIFQRHNKCNPFLFSSKYCSFNNVLLTQCIHRSIIQLTMIRIWLFGGNM